MKSKTFKLITFAFLMLFAAPQLFAHALWIETKATGTKGKAQEISIYFGEFSDNDITKADKWFSDLKDFSLVVISPSKKETKLTSKENELIRLLASEMNKLVNRSHALKQIWGDDSYFNARSMDVYLSKIRKILKDDPRVQIITIHGEGFKMVVTE